MQTFLPFEDFVESAKVLDDRRLNKQRLEAKQILELVRQHRKYANDLVSKQIEPHLWAGEEPKAPTAGWANHPAVLMWAKEPNDTALCRYGLEMCDEWLSRGFNDDADLYGFFRDGIKHYRHTVPRSELERSGPWWLGNEIFHESHMAALYEKDPVHYADFAHARRRTCCLECNYWWPTHAAGLK